MSEERAPLRAIAWRDLCPWVHLFRTARLAVAPRLLLLAALALFLTAVGWWAIGHLYAGQSDDLQRLGWIDETAQWPWTTHAVDLYELDAAHINPLRNPIVGVGVWLCRPFVHMFDLNAGFVPFSYAFLCGLWALAVWALFAGAITRIVAMALAQEGRVSLVEGLRFSLFKWPSCFFAPLFPLLGVLGLSLVIGSIFGVIMRADLGLLVMSILWPLMLMASAVMAILILGLMFGWALMWPTVGVESTDSFDALSRSYSYTFQRPFHYLFYVLVSGIIGLLSAAVVSFLAIWTVRLAFWAATWGAGVDRTGDIILASDPPAGFSTLFSSGASILGFWNGCVLLLGAAYLFSFFWTAATAIYFLLRRSVDGAELDEVFVKQEEETYGLPPLQPSDSGIPQVIDPPPSSGP